MALTDLRFEYVEREMEQVRRRLERLETHEVAILGGAGGAAPADAQYVVVAVSTLLTAERAAAATSPVVITDGGAGGNLTWSHANSGVVAGVYGNATNVAQVTINATGHVTAASNVAISGSGSGVAGQVAYWATGTTIAGDAGLTYDAATDSLTLLSALTTKPVLTLENTNTDAQAQVLLFYKNSASPADNDDLGAIDFYGETSTGAQERYAYILSESLDVTNGDTAGSLRFQVTMDGVERNYLELKGYNGSVNEGEIIFNEGGQNVDLRIESVNQPNMIFVDAANDRVGIGTNAPSSDVTIVGTFLEGKNTEANNITKFFVYSIGHYDNAEEPFGVFFGRCVAAQNIAYFGGGYGGANAATKMQFYTAANTTTTVGTLRIFVGSDGYVGIPTTSPDRLLHVEVSDAVTAAVTYARRTSHATSGAAAALFGVGAEDELEDAGGNMQVASERATLWGTATAGAESPLIRFRPYPKGTAYGAGSPVWSWDGVDGTARTVIPNGAGDVAYIAVFLYTVYAVTGTDTTSGVVSVEPGGSWELYDDGTDVLTLACAADGSVTVQRTAGADTFNVTLSGTWQ